IAYQREVGFAAQLASSYSREKETSAEAAKWLDRAMGAMEGYVTGPNEDALLSRSVSAEMRERLLAEPRRFFEQIERELSSKPAPTDRQRELLARGRQTLGGISLILGHAPEAAIDYERSIAAYQTLADAHPEVLKYRAGLASSLS